MIIIDFATHREALRQIETALGLTDAEKAAARKLGTRDGAVEARQKGKLLAAAKAGIGRCIIEEVIVAVTDEIYETITDVHGVESASERTTKAVHEARQSFRAAHDTIINRIAETLLEIESSGRPFQLRDITRWSDGDGNSLFSVEVKYPADLD